MARQTNAAYWAQRMKNMEDALLDQSYSYVENLEKQFAAAQAEIERQLARWYQSFATNNEIDLAEAKRLLNSKELKEFHWTVAEYIAYGEQNAIDGAWMKQLENASARVHISRLEALKLQRQQQAEVLYSNQLDYVDAAARMMYDSGFYVIPVLPPATPRDECLLRTSYMATLTEPLIDEAVEINGSELREKVREK